MTKTILAIHLENSSTPYVLNNYIGQVLGLFKKDVSHNGHFDRKTFQGMDFSRGEAEKHFLN